MKLTKSQINRILDLTKHIESKDTSITAEITDGIIVISSKSNEMQIRLKNIKTEESDTNPIAFSRLFLSKLSKLSADEFIITPNEKTLLVKSKSVKVQSSILGVESHADFAETPVEKNRIIITKEVITALLTATQYIDEKGTRKPLAGVNLKLLNGKLTVTATNSFRFYSSSFETDNKEDVFSVILPIITINALASIYDITNDKGFPLNVTNSGVFVNVKSLYFQSILIAETYPDVEKIWVRIEQEPIIGEIQLDEEQIANLKFIGTKNQWLRISRNNVGIVIFTSKTEVDKNEFAIKTDNTKPFEEISVNYNEFVSAATKISKMIIKPSTFVFQDSSGIIILMAAIQKENDTK